MRIKKSNGKLVVALPEELVNSLDLKPGDELHIVNAMSASITVTKVNESARKKAHGRIRKRARKFPDDYVFDRGEANER